MPYYSTFKFRIYPNQEQGQELNCTFGSIRFLYNQMLNDKINHYELNGEAIEYKVKDYYGEFRFLYAVDPAALQFAKGEVDRAFKALISKNKYPTYKRRKAKQSYVCPNKGNAVHLSEDKRYINLPKVGAVRIHAHRPLPPRGELVSVTVMKVPSGKFYAALLWATPSGMVPNIPIIDDTAIGLDYSAAHFYVDSNGNKPTPPRFYKSQETRLKRAYKKLHRMTHGGKNYTKQKNRIARLHEHIVNQRHDYLHKQSHLIAKDWDTVCVETLDMRRLSRGLNLGKSTSENAFGTFRVMLKYKLERQGKHLLFVNQWAKTSQTCHVCGYRKKDLTLKDREWTCPNCHTHHDRDINAAINIKDMVLKYY